MSEEIKEILDWLKDYNRPFGISIYDRKILSNYITNLQQKVEQLEKENERLNNIINELEEYTTENIEVLENRLNSPFCNFEKVTKELLIFQNYLDNLKELKEDK